MLRHRQLCRDIVSVPLLQIYVTTAFVLVLVITMFLVLSAFQSRPEKSVATESCCHLT